MMNSDLRRRFWSSITLLVRLDMAASIAVAAALSAWLMWH
jgi:hypothetical protein